MRFIYIDREIDMEKLALNYFSDNGRSSITKEKEKESAEKIKKAYKSKGSLNRTAETLPFDINDTMLMCYEAELKALKKFPSIQLLWKYLGDIKLGYIPVGYSAVDLVDRYKELNPEDTKVEFMSASDELNLEAEDRGIPYVKLVGCTATTDRFLTED